MSANGIAHLATKELRQKAKLALATTDRAATNRRAGLDITELPTQYTGDAITDNPNVGGLVVGRPWVDLSAGASRKQYTGYYNNVATFFDALTPTATTTATNFDSTLTAGQPNISQQYLGFFKSDYTGTWTFAGNSDDASTMWFGDYAKSGYTIANSNANTTIGSWSFTVNLVAGKYYPFRVQFGNGPAGPGSLTITIAHTGLSATNVFTGRLYYNSVTNGF
jgi:hypothetical protein